MRESAVDLLYKLFKISYSVRYNTYSSRNDENVHCDDNDDGGVNDNRNNFTALRSCQVNFMHCHWMEEDKRARKKNFKDEEKEKDY